MWKSILNPRIALTLVQCFIFVVDSSHKNVFLAIPCLFCQMSYLQEHVLLVTGGWLLKHPKVEPTTLVVDSG